MNRLYVKLLTDICIWPWLRVTKAGQKIMSTPSQRKSLGCKMPVTLFSEYMFDNVLITILSFNVMVISDRFSIGCRTFGRL